MAGPASQTSGADLLASADLDHDGRVTRSEFLKRREAEFPALDLDRDGWLSLEEFKVSMPKGYRAFAGVAFGRIDANKDKKLSRGEFNAGPTPGFDRADRNGDGALDAAELTAARSQLGR
jgi:Ca2+-binding EF-hand superfamily protein